MSELIHRTVDTEVSLLIEPDGTVLLPLKVRVNGVTVASFDVCMVFDLMMGSLRALEEPSGFLGVDRRAYISRNCHRLTDEWLEAQDD